ncbi:hypothetical protein D9M73_261300 [compost metagenome]
MGGQKRRRFAQIDRRSATQGNDAIAVIVLEHRSSGDDRLLGGIGWRLVEDRGGRRGQGPEYAIKQPGSAHALVGDDQGPPYAQAIKLGRQ